MAGVLTNGHVTAVLDEIELLSPAYLGDNTQHLHELMYFVHAAYYLKFYNANNVALFTLPAVQPAAEQAFVLAVIELVRAGDVPRYDAKIAQLKADANLQARLRPVPPEPDRRDSDARQPLHDRPAAERARRRDARGR